jgi:hypothetical protein
MRELLKDVTQDTTATRIKIAFKDAPFRIHLTDVSQGFTVTHQTNVSLAVAQYIIMTNVKASSTVTQIMNALTLALALKNAQMVSTAFNPAEFVRNLVILLTLTHAPPSRTHTVILQTNVLGSAMKKT